MKKILTKKNMDLYATAAFGVLAFLALLSVLYFIIFKLRFVYNSDYADTLMWTDAMVQGKGIFNRNFSYACLMPFGGQWFFLPFYPIFGVSVNTAICGMSLFVVCLVCAILFFCRSLNFEWKWSFFSVFAVLSVFTASEKLREIYFGHILYYSLGSFGILIGLSLLIRTNRAYNTKKWLPYAIGSVLWIVLCSANGLYLLGLFAIPATLALFLDTLLSPSLRLTKGRGLSQVVLAISSVIGIVLGLVLRAALVGGMIAEYAEAFSSYGASGDIGDHFHELIPSYLTLFTGSFPELNISFASFTGIHIALRLFLAVALFVFSLVPLFLYRQFEKGERMLVITHWVSVGIVLFGFLFGYLSNANWRLCPLIFTSILVTVVTLRKLWNMPKIVCKRFAFLFVLCFVIICIFLCGVLWAFNLSRPVIDSDEYDYVRLADFLKNSGLTYGYADFWDSHVITALTDNQVKVRPVEIEPKSTITPRNYQSDNRWYVGQGPDEYYFLLLTQDSLHLVQDSLDGHIVQTRELGQFVVCYLDGDIFPLP